MVIYVIYGYQKLLKDSHRKTIPDIKGISRDIKGYQGISGDTLGYQVITNDIKSYLLGLLTVLA